MGTVTVLSGRNGEVRYFGHTIALLASWTHHGATRSPRVGTTVARITFSPKSINQFWANFAAPTHIALPMRQGGTGPRRVYELIECDLNSGKAVVRTPPCAIEERR